MTSQGERFSRGLMGGVYIVVLAAMMIIGVKSPSEGANSTAAGIVWGRSADATSIRLSMPYTGDDNANNTYTIDYKTCASGTWTNWVTNAPHSPSPYTTAITGLINNQCYSIRATYTDNDGISGRNPQTIQISAGWDSTLLHNSNRFPGTTKWSGDWGTPTGQYNRIVCETCHTRTTANIKRIKDTVITAPNSPAQRFPAETGGMAPVFQSVTAPDGFGDDTGGHSSSQKICEVCHSATSYHRYNTVGQTGLDHNNTTDCIACHPHSLGFKDAAACNSCHGAPPGGGTDTNTPVVFAASHAKHYDAGSGGAPVNYSAVSNRSTAVGYVFDCGICHSSNNAHHLANQDGTVDVMLPAGGVYTPGSYVGGDNLPPPGSVTFRNSNGTCSNVYCHGNYPGSGKNATPIWGAASGGACGTCHNASNTSPPNSGQHGKHTTTHYYEFKCTVCHRDIVGGASPAAYTIEDKSKHVNRVVDYKFDPADPRVAGGTYSIDTGTAAPTNGTTPRAFGSCNNIYCHSNVQPEGGVGAPTSYSNPSWASAGTAACGSCHAGGHGNLITTGSHSKHLAYTFTTSNMYKCIICHSWDQSQSLNCSSCHNFIVTTEYAKHANYKVEIAFDTAFNSSATYGKSPTFTPGTGYSNCVNTYCHSAGTSVATTVIPANTTTNWGTGVLACDSCHTGGTTTGPTYSTGSPKTNSHNKHVVGNSYKCVDCHSAVVDISNAIIDKTKHVNKAYDVTGARITTYNFLTDGGTCATACHGATTPKWGGISTGCNYCHGSLSGAHGTHIGSLVSGGTAAYGVETNVSTSGEYRFQCGNCHPNNTANHVNGTVEIELYRAGASGFKGMSATADRTGSGTSTVCQNVACHSNGMASPTFALTPQWGSIYTAGACSGCHGNSPNSAGQPAGSPAHGIHVVGIHFDNIYNGTSGLAAAGTAVFSSHGSADSSTTINCNICHSDTVTSSVNDLNDICSSCHNGTQATQRGIAVIADKSFHVNGAVEVVFQTVQVKSKAQLRDNITTVDELNNNWSRNASSYKAGATPNDTAVSALNTGSMWTAGIKSCSNVACHNSKSVAWTDTVNCGSCHTKLPQ